VITFGCAVLVLALAYDICVVDLRWRREHRFIDRNFYGELRVQDRVKGNERVRNLLHGTINHGTQFLKPELQRKPLSYYGPKSGAGLAIVDRQEHGPIRLGVIGLGAGTLAAYARSQDSVRFYEINPLVEQIARSQFTYLSECPSKLAIVLGDGRRSLETEPPQQFDVLAIDAFSSDAIPVHLLTIEAFEQYFRHLKADGIVAVHVSNRFLELEWVVRLAAQALHKKALLVSDDDEEDATALSNSNWMLVASANDAFSAPKWHDLGEASERPPHLHLWTDEYSNLLAIIK
jgi:hypothetical protein